MNWKSRFECDQRGGYGFKNLPNVLMLTMYYLISKSRSALGSFSREGAKAKIISNK